MSLYSPFVSHEAIEIEQFHRSQCARQGQEHECIGCITIKPGLCILDCKLCGIATVNLCEAMIFLDGNNSHRRHHE